MIIMTKRLNHKNTIHRLTNLILFIFSRPYHKSHFIGRKVAFSYTNGLENAIKVPGLKKDINDTR